MIVMPWREWDRLAAHVERAAPEEACGLLAAFRYAPEVVELAVPMLNVSEHARVRYEIDPRHHMEAVGKLDDQNMKVIGIYHSHVDTGPRMSDHDIRYAIDSSKVHLIVSYAPRWATMDYGLWRVEYPAGVASVVPVPWHLVEP